MRNALCCSIHSSVRLRCLTAECVEEEGPDLGLHERRQVQGPFLLRLGEALPRPRQVLQAGLLCMAADGGR